MRSTRVAIIGGGAIGRAVATLVRPRARVVLWDVDPRRVRGPRDLATALRGATVVVLAVPATVLRAAARSVRPHLPARVPVVAVAKGFEPETGRTTDAVLAHALPRNPAVLLSGPMLAQELAAGMPGFAVVASRSSAARNTVAALFRGSVLSVEPSTDARGVALAGAIKNVYAVALGIAEGLRWGSNAKGELVAESIHEATELLVRLGGRRATALGTAGLGDLVTTGFSPKSRNRSVGRALAANPRARVESEGTRAIRVLVRTVGPARRRFPVLMALAFVTIRHRPATLAFAKLP